MCSHIEDEEVEVIPHPSAPSLEHTLSFSQAVPSRSPTVEVLIAESVHLVKEKRKAMAGVSMEENEDENVGDDAGFSSTQVRVADADEEKPLLVERRRRTSSTLEAGNPPDIQDPEEQPPKRRGVQAVFGLTTSPSELQAQRAVPQRVDVNRPPQPSNPNPGIAFRAGLRSTGLIRHGNFKRQVDSTSSPVATVLATRGVNGVFPSTPPVPTPATTSRAVAVLKPPTARAPTPPRAVPVPSTFIHERRSAFRASGKWVRPIPPPAARCPSSALPAQRGSSSPKRQVFVAPMLSAHAMQAPVLPNWSPSGSTAHSPRTPPRTKTAALPVPPPPPMSLSSTPKRATPVRASGNGTSRSPPLRPPSGVCQEATSSASVQVLRSAGKVSGGGKEVKVRRSFRDENASGALNVLSELHAKIYASPTRWRL